MATGRASWKRYGRTTSPKNLASDDHTSPTEVDVVLVATLDAVTDGYMTENQRYLHILLVDKNDGGSLTVTLYGYDHAFGKWAPLNATDTSTPLTITVANSSTAEGSQTAAHRELVTFEITGVDRVGFVGTTADVRCYAACSTF